MSRHLRRCLHAAGLSLFLATPAMAQGEAPPDAPEHYNACISEATSRHNIILTADKSIYSCFGAAAQNYFTYLVSKNAAQTVDKQRTGTYIFREIPKIGRCWTKIENVDGVETATYGCSINVVGPPR
jgi:hypothetical protein